MDVAGLDPFHVDVALAFLKTRQLHREAEVGLDMTGRACRVLVHGQMMGHHREKLHLARGEVILDLPSSMGHTCLPEKQEEDRHEQTEELDLLHLTYLSASDLPPCPTLVVAVPEGT
jgi:hypothetical protein